MGLYTLSNVLNSKKFRPQFESYEEFKDYFSARMTELSRPRPITAAFIPERPSLYWVDKVPDLPKDGKTKFVGSEREAHLARPIWRVPDFECSRDHPIPVSRAALKAYPSPRLCMMSQPKQRHPDFVVIGPARFIISEGALTAVASPRTIELAKPNPHIGFEHEIDSSTRIGFFEGPLSERMEEIALPHQLHPCYLPSIYGYQPVKKGALNAQPTERMQQLAVPAYRRDVIAEDNRVPGSVSPAALKAKLTPRLDALAKPHRRNKK